MALHHHLLRKLIRRPQLMGDMGHHPLDIQLIRTMTTTMVGTGTTAETETETVTVIVTVVAMAMAAMVVVACHPLDHPQATAINLLHHSRLLHLMVGGQVRQKETTTAERCGIREMHLSMMIEIGICIVIHMQIGIGMGGTLGAGI
jgi:hypothetical protein